MMVKRIVPVLMCLILCLTLLPTSAMAAWSTEGPLNPNGNNNNSHPGWSTEGPITPEKPDPDDGDDDADADADADAKSEAKRS